MRATFSALAFASIACVAQAGGYTYHEYTNNGAQTYGGVFSHHGKYLMLRQFEGGQDLVFGSDYSTPAAYYVDNSATYTDISDKGVQSYWDKNGNPFTYDIVTQTLTPLSIVTPLDPDIYNLYVNARGNVAGTDFTASGAVSRSFRESGGVLKIIFTGPEGSPISSKTLGVGDDDLQFGISSPDVSFNTYTGFLYREGAPTIVDSGLPCTYLGAVNDGDAAAGLALNPSEPSESYTFIYSQGTFKKLPQPYAGAEVYPSGIDNYNEVLGLDSVTGTTIFWDKTGTPYNATTYLDNILPESVIDGAPAVRALFLDADGDIFGQYLDEYYTPHTFVLTYQ